mmetsp:Transcript_24954/g.74890  ORF Transcript_24954/g.74890 Transcript_24954/m.74890 type:complete len:322 (-) Transcript_24954:19-984(-)
MMGSLVIFCLLELAAPLLLPRRPARRSTALAASSEPQPEWLHSLNNIDENMWRALRRELYGGPDVAAPSTLKRFEAHCEARRTNGAADVDLIEGGRRAIYSAQQYENLTATPVWDLGHHRFDWLGDLERAAPAMARELQRARGRWRESKWVDTYGHDGAYDSGWDMVHLSDVQFAAAEDALRRVPVSPRFRSIARQRADRAIHRHSDRVPWVLTCHVALDGPEGSAYMVVDGERMEWTIGSPTLCDTTFFHSAHNEHPTDDMHLLHVDVFHPDLSADERAALTALHRHLDEAEAKRLRELTPVVSLLESAFAADSADPRDV